MSFVTLRVSQNWTALMLWLDIFGNNLVTSLLHLKMNWFKNENSLKVVMRYKLLEQTGFMSSQDYVSLNVASSKKIFSIKSWFTSLQSQKLLQ